MTPPRDPTAPQIVIALVIAAKVGSWFSFLTLAYLAAVGSLLWPPFYKQYKHEVDDIFSAGKKWVEEQLKAVPGFIPKAEIAKKAQ